MGTNYGDPKRDMMEETPESSEEARSIRQGREEERGENKKIRGRRKRRGTSGPGRCIVGGAVSTISTKYPGSYRSSPNSSFKAPAEITKPEQSLPPAAITAEHCSGQAVSSLCLSPTREE